MLTAEDSEASAGSDGRIRFALRVGVVGHRTLKDAAGVARTANAVLDRLDVLLPRGSSTAVVLVALSSLAEGADRLLALQVLARTGAALEAILPCSPDDYASDFPASLTEFQALLGRAADVRWPLVVGRREEAYAAAARLVIDRADLLLAVWDGRETGAMAGTAPAVARARARRIPVFVIDPANTGVVREEVGEGLPDHELDALDHFNRPRLQHRPQSAPLPLEGHQSGPAAPPWMAELLAWHLPAFLRADMLADRYRRWNAAVSDAIFLLGALALTTVGAQLLFLQATPAVAWIEVAALLLLLAVLMTGRYLKVHARWIAYRFLAERLRASVFVAAVGSSISVEASSERVLGAHDAEPWLKRAIEQAWRERPSFAVTPRDFEPVRSFVQDGWVKRQLGYFAASGRRHELRLRRLEGVAVALFAVTVMLASLHALGVGDSPTGAEWWAKTATLLTIGLPALAVAFSGVRTQRDHARNSLRFHRMTDRMEIAASQLAAAVDLEDLQRIVTELDADMLDENRDWLLSILLHGRPELGA